MCTEGSKLNHRTSSSPAEGIRARYIRVRQACANVCELHLVCGLITLQNMETGGVQARCRPNTTWSSRQGVLASASHANCTHSHAFNLALHAR
jgi:hypothetical protein